MNSKIFLLFLSGFFPLLCQSQVFDFRKGSLKTREGVSTNGKIGYNLGFPNNDYIRFKSLDTQAKISLSSIERFSTNGQQFRVIRDTRDSGSYRAGLLIANGEIEVIESQKKYFLIYKDSTYFLDNSKNEKQVGGAIRVTKSGLYMVTLNRLFKDCHLNFSQISLKLNQKTLLQFLDSASRCRNLQFTPTRKIKRWHVGVIGGIGTSTFQSQDVLAGIRSNAMRFSTVGVTITRDVFGINKLKFRMDVNFRNNQFIGSTVWRNRGTTELANYEMRYSDIELPMGLQYYLFKSNFGIYMNLGFMAYSSFNTKLNIDAFELMNDQYIPRYQLQINARSNDFTIAGYWGGGGFEFDLSKQLSSFIEFRYEINESIKVNQPLIIPPNSDLKFEELSCRFGIKMSL